MKRCSSSSYFFLEIISILFVYSASICSSSYCVTAMANSAPAKVPWKKVLSFSRSVTCVRISRKGRGVGEVGVWSEVWAAKS